MKNIKAVVTEKVEGKWVTRMEEDGGQAWESLATALYRKQLEQCRYIKRIVRRNLGNATEITVFYYNWLKCTYTITE